MRLPCPRLAVAMSVVVVSIVPRVLAAEEFTVSQIGKHFEPSELTATVGDTVVFMNDDRFAHNIYSETPGFEFEFRKQMPGESDVLTLEKAGEFEVSCAIHPRMKLRIVVTPP
jgi:plastocyanin